MPGETQKSILPHPPGAEDMPAPQKQFPAGETRQWARLGGWLGIAWPLLFIAVVIYSQAFGLESLSAKQLLSASPATRHATMFLHTIYALLGLLGIGWSIGLNRVLQAERSNLSGTLAMAFAVVGFATLAAMVIVQGSVMVGMGKTYASAQSEVGRNAVLNTYHALRWIDQGLDFAWDIFIAWAMILFSVAMLRHPTFGKLWGIFGIGVAAPLFALDVWYAPEPATPDLGVISFIWFLGVSVKMLIYAHRTEHAVAQASITPA